VLFSKWRITESNR